MDIDIDIKSTFKPEKCFNVTRASGVENGELKPHNVGIYFQNIPKDPVTKLAAIPYKEAEDFGYIKIDMLNLNLLNNFNSKEELLELMEKEPQWELLENREFVSRLFHLSKQFEVVYKIKPKSILDIADILCLIRPHKKYLIDKYIKNKAVVRKELYIKREHGDMRKSHAVAYAMLVVLHMNLLTSGKDYAFEAFE